MGFFSNNKKSSAPASPDTRESSQQNGSYSNGNGGGVNATAYSQQSLRAKLYGKLKGKQKEFQDDPDGIQIGAAASRAFASQAQASALAARTRPPTTTLAHSQSSPMLNIHSGSNGVSEFGASASTARASQHQQQGTSTGRPLSIHVPTIGPTSSSAYASSTIRSGSTAQLGPSSAGAGSSSGAVTVNGKTKKRGSMNPPPLPDKTNSSVGGKGTDAVTMNLAQRLNDLATANSKGIISDDEYRILRQDLFDRMTSGTPTQPTASTSTSSNNRNSSHPPSTFHLNPDLLSNPNSLPNHKGKTPSITSKNSKTSKTSNGKSISSLKSSAAGFLFRNGSGAQKGKTSFEAASAMSGSANSQAPETQRERRNIYGRPIRDPQNSLYGTNGLDVDFAPTPSSSSPGSSLLHGQMHGHRSKRSALLRNNSGLTGSSTSLALESESQDWDAEGGGGAASNHDRKNSIMRLKANRSTPSMRRMPPPSSFHHHNRDKSSHSQSSQTSSHAYNLSSSHTQANPPTSPTWDKFPSTLLDAADPSAHDALTSSEEVREVIKAVEAECGRMMDLFGGLEMRMSIKAGNPTNHSLGQGGVGSESNFDLVSIRSGGTGFGRSPSVASDSTSNLPLHSLGAGMGVGSRRGDGDVASMRSGRSYRTTHTTHTTHTNASSVYSHSNAPSLPIPSMPQSLPSSLAGSPLVMHRSPLSGGSSSSGGGGGAMGGGKRLKLFGNAVGDAMSIGLAMNPSPLGSGSGSHSSQTSPNPNSGLSNTPPFSLPAVSQQGAPSAPGSRAPSRASTRSRQGSLATRSPIIVPIIPSALRGSSSNANSHSNSHSHSGSHSRSGSKDIYAPNASVDNLSISGLSNHGMGMGTIRKGVVGGYGDVEVRALPSAPGLTRKKASPSASVSVSPQTGVDESESAAGVLGIAGLRGVGGERERDAGLDVDTTLRPGVGRGGEGEESAPSSAGGGTASGAGTPSSAGTGVRKLPPLPISIPQSHHHPSPSRSHPHSHSQGDAYTGVAGGGIISSGSLSRNASAAHLPMPGLVEEEEDTIIAPRPRIDSDTQVPQNIPPPPPLPPLPAHSQPSRPTHTLTQSQSHSSSSLSGGLNQSQTTQSRHVRSPSRATMNTVHTNVSDVSFGGISTMTSALGAFGSNSTGGAGAGVGGGMSEADVRRRREEVMGMYEERLEYLRAKLKGAELREKLLRR